MSALEVVLSDFVADVNRVRDLLGLIKDFREFGSSVAPEEIQKEEIVWKEAMVLKSAAPTLRTDLPLLSGSMVLYLCGRFEYFVRQLVEALGDEIANNAAEYGELPADLRDELRKKTLEVARTPTKYGFSASEADALLVALATNLNSVKSAGPVLIGSRVLSVTESNMRAVVLNDLMRRVGMKEIWKELGKQAKLKLFLQKQNDGECSAAAQRRLDDLMRERNQIAHPTGGTSFPDPDQVLWIAGFLEALGAVLVDLCHVHLATFAPRATSAGVDPFL